MTIEYKNALQNVWELTNQILKKAIDQHQTIFTTMPSIYLHQLQGQFPQFTIFKDKLEIKMYGTGMFSLSFLHFI